MAKRKRRSNKSSKKRLDINGDPIELSDEERTIWCDGKAKWVAPDDMPDDLAKRVILGKACGAKKKNNTGYCKLTQVYKTKSRVPPFRCKHHGGATPGAPKGNLNNFKHGVYTNAMLPGEEEVWERMKADGLDDEIVLLKVRLRRAVIAEAKQAEMLAAQKTPEEIHAEDGNQTLIETTSEEGYSGHSASAKNVKKIKVVDWSYRIERIVNQLQKLMALKLQKEGGDGDTVEDQMANARAFLKSLREEVHSPATNEEEERE